MMGRKATRNMQSSNANKVGIRASVGFIHKESVTMHGNTIVKIVPTCFGIIAIFRELTPMLLKRTPIKQFYYNQSCTSSEQF
jgi:hypothetical protein